MKKRKKRQSVHQSNISFILWLIMLSILLCGGGVTYSILKNAQVECAREIQQLENELNSCKMTEEYYRSKMISMTSHWAMRAKLAEQNSILQPIENDQLEFITPDRPSRGMASN